MARKFGLAPAHWAAVGVGVLLLALLLWFAYQRGLAHAGLELSDQARARRELLAQIELLEAENGKLNAKVAELEMARRLDREAYGQVEKSLGELQSNMSRQGDDLAFYKSIVSPADGVAGLRIQRFEIAPGTAPREFILRVTLIQAMRHDRTAAGLVQIVLNGLRDQRPAQVTVGELLGRPRAQLPFSFKYFQTIEQAITLPEGFEVFDVAVKISAGRLRAPFEQSFPWKVGSPAVL
jgi:hypothetical protein